MVEVIAVNSYQSEENDDNKSIKQLSVTTSKTSNFQGSFG